jgi:hypothetical protein
MDDKDLVCWSFFTDPNVFLFLKMIFVNDMIVLQVAIHQILYLRGLYPTNIFFKCKKYKIPVMRSDHPWVRIFAIIAGV